MLPIFDRNEPEIYVTLNDTENYQVSNYANFLKLENGIWINIPIIQDKRGYCTIIINGHRRSVHRLVAYHFVPNIYNLPIVNHIDGDPSNNYFRNLEWCSYSHNLNHRILTNTHNRGEDNPVAKLNNQQVLQIYNLAHNSNLTQTQIAKMFNIDRKTVSDIKLGVSWNHLTHHHPLKIISRPTDGKSSVKRVVGRLKGGDIKTSKLTEEDVLKIYDLSHNSNLSQTQIAKMFGICRQSVSDIKLGKTWNHITNHNKGEE